MFNLFHIREAKRERKIDLQIQVFLKWRTKRGMPISDYDDWLARFLAFTDKNDVLDLTAIDIVAFLEHVREKYTASSFLNSQAEKAVRQLRRFYSARGKMMKDIADYQRILDSEGVNFIADIKRNKEIVEIYLKDRNRPFKDRKWTYRKIGEEYGIHWTRVGQIIKRELSRS